MSHEMYGLKHPHQQWEGILALDIWYNLLYKEIDAKYPFEDKYMGLNPMQRREIYTSDENEKYVAMDDGRSLVLNEFSNSISDGTCKWKGD